MAVSRQRSLSTHKKNQLQLKLKKDKLKTKRTMESNQNQLPKVRQFPAWKSTAQLSITGQELEAIAQFMDNASSATMAYQNIVNRGLIEGLIELKYEKLNEEATAYVPMNDEESKPYRDQFESLVKQAKEIAEQAKKNIEQEKELAESQKDLPRIDAVVDPTGQPAETKIITS